MTYAHPISVAPMMDYTDRHFRYLLRLISKHTLLYTEMITCEAILNGDADRLLAYDVYEHPLALQLGGSDPEKLAHCARIAEDLGYDEVNLNAGCPSDRVKQGRFGAYLMKEPALVSDCLTAMREAVNIPVTLKTRIGVDDQDRYEDLTRFVDHVIAAKCTTLIVHARKAWLKGLSPKQNRTIPPLNYPTVYQLKKDFPHLNIILNGGIEALDEIPAMLAQVDGVMMGRQVCKNPYVLSQVDQRFYHDAHPVPSRIEIVHQMLPYIEAQLKSGLRLNTVARHLLNLFHGEPHANQWRRHLSEHIHQADKRKDLYDLFKNALSVFE